MHVLVGRSKLCLLFAFLISFQRDDRLAREAAALSRSRQSLGKALSERMQGLEDTSDVLLVRPAFASSIR